MRGHDVTEMSLFQMPNFCLFMFYETFVCYNSFSSRSPASDRETTLFYQRIWPHPRSRLEQPREPFHKLIHLLVWYISVDLWAYSKLHRKAKIRLGITPNADRSVPSFWSFWTRLTRCIRKYSIRIRPVFPYFRSSRKSPTNIPTDLCINSR